jgi:hypothetical protein
MVACVQLNLYERIKNPFFTSPRRGNIDNDEPGRLKQPQNGIEDFPPSLCLKT